MKKMLSLMLIACLLIMTACAGSAPHPVDVYKYGDDKKPCNMLAMEIDQIGEQVKQEYKQQSDKNAQNGIAFVGGVLFLIPFFAMDSRSDHMLEAEALLDRRDALQTIMVDNECNDVELIESRSAFLASIGKKEPSGIKSRSKGDSVTQEGGNVGSSRESTPYQNGYGNHAMSGDLTQ